MHVLDELARDNHRVPPTHRLRLALEAGCHILGVDVIACFLGTELLPFGQAIVQHAAADRPTFDYLWPFYFAGVYDPVPLYAMLEPSHAGRLRNIPEGEFCTVDSIYATDSEYAGSFAFRERISHIHKVSRRDRNELRMSLFFNKRLPPNAPRGRHATQPTPEWSKPALRKFADRTFSIARQLKSYYDKNEEMCREREVYHDKTASFVRQMECVARDIEVRPSHLRFFFQTLLNAATTLSGDPSIAGSCYCVARKVEPHEYRLAARPLRNGEDAVDKGLKLVPVALAGLVHRNRKSCIREFRYGAMLETLDAEKRLCIAPKPGTRAYWDHTPFDDPALQPRGSRCGLISLATHWGSPLYLGDARRRFCCAAPSYGLAYSEYDDECQFAYALPLIMHLGAPGDADRAPHAFGAIALEGPRRRGIKLRDASFLAALLHLGASKLSSKTVKSGVEVAVLEDT